MKKTILFVDDELKVLDGLHRMLQPMSAHWEMAFAKNGLEALSNLGRKHFDVVVTDLAMPGMDGPKLLAEVLKRYPHIIRFVHSTQAEREKIYRSIGPAHQFLPKPATPEAIHTAINRSLALRDLLGADNLRQLVSRIGVLPTMPTLYFQVVKAIEAPDASVREIGAIIEQDMGMSAKVLQLVNSAFFGLRQHVSSPAQAASLLGLDIIKSLVAWFHVASQYHGIDVSGFSFEELQRHSSTVGAYAQAIAKHEGMSKHETDDIFMAGLFHDMGQLILAGNLPKQYEQLHAMAKMDKLPLINEEQAHLGTTHAGIGAYLLSLWGFADPIVEACCHHHTPHQHPGKTMDTVTIIYVANILDQEFTAAKQGKTPPGYNSKYLQSVGAESRLPAWRAVCQQIYQQTVQG